MLFPTQPVEKVQIAQEVQSLCGRCRGPENIRRDLASWATRYAAGEPSTETSDSLKSAIGALLLLSFANSAFRVASLNRGYPPERDIEIEDLGGAFPALFLASALVVTQEDPALRKELDDYVWRENDRLASQIMIRLPC